MKKLTPNLILLVALSFGCSNPSLEDPIQHNQAENSETAEPEQAYEVPEYHPEIQFKLPVPKQQQLALTDGKQDFYFPLESAEFFVQIDEEESKGFQELALIGGPTEDKKDNCFCFFSPFPSSVVDEHGFTDIQSLEGKVLYIQDSIVGDELSSWVYGPDKITVHSIEAGTIEFTTIDRIDSDWIGLGTVTIMIENGRYEGQFKTKLSYQNIDDSQ